MRRRDLISLICGAAAWPLAARSQQPKLLTIGFLGATTLSAWGHSVATFVKRLRELGWIEGRTVAIEFRWAEGRHERYADIAAEFVRLRVDVIFAHTTPNVVAVKKATSVIPIIFIAGDPVSTGIVASLARPGGNLTGLSSEATDIAGKRLELLRELITDFRRLAVLGNAANPLNVLE